MTDGEPTTPFAKDLVLVGGGHSHALMLRMMGMKPLEGVRVTLVSDVSHAPYSGMLPGFIAGFYSYDETHIDLRRLCQFAGVRFVLAEATGLDLEKKRVVLEGRSPIGFDFVSLNIGSTPNRIGVAGADFAIPSKPVPELLEKWNEVVAAEEKSKAVIVGAGAGGVEMAISMKRQLGEKLDLEIVHDGAEILPTHNAKVRAIFREVLEEAGIRVRLGERVAEVRADGVRCESGLEIGSDRVFWVTNASPPSWLAEAGLEVDERGFVLISQTLQSRSHPFVFAAGDVATIDGMPRPKSGVFAVRMAKPLWKNVQRIFADRPLARYRPQKEFLSLIGTATGEAVASKGKNLALKSAAMWRLKDWIDRKFMQKFEELPKMGEEEDDLHGQAEGEGGEAGLPKILEELRARSQMRCLGCAAKVGASVLSKALDRIREEHGELAALSEFDAGDDAAVFPVPAGRQLVQTVDYLPALVADPYDFGRIATLHCFSDIFAMGAEAHSALATVLLPFGAENVTEETLFQVLSGMIASLEDSGAKLFGGHTAEGETLALGITCNGTTEPGAALKKGGIEAEQAIILTKPIGTGTLFAAEMRLEAKGRWIDAALVSMLKSNREPAQIFRRHGATACTDVTGFGLMGHLLEMLRPSRIGAAFDLTALPILDGALETSGQGILSSLHLQNARAANGILNARDFADHEKYALLFDPQTSGGLLASLPKGNVAACLAELREAGAEAVRVAETVGLEDADAPVVLGI